jgi:hypothetical protein
MQPDDDILNMPIQYFIEYNRHLDLMNALEKQLLMIYFPMEYFY